MRLLLVEDEELLSKSLAKGLRKRGYAVDCVFDGTAALKELEINEYDLMILDLNLPEVDGLEVLRRLRESNRELRVLILSARSSVEDKIGGLDLGANDYLTKPFDFGELEARVRALLRRSFQQENVVLSYGGLRADTAAKSVTLDGKPIALTKKEYGILEYLLYHSGRAVSAEELIEHVWDNGADPFSNALKFQMHSLRKKLAEAGGRDCIETLRGLGYRLAAPGGREPDGEGRERG